MTVSVLSAVFLSKYDFPGIRRVPGIIAILENKTAPDRTLSPCAHPSSQQCVTARDAFIANSVLRV